MANQQKYPMPTAEEAMEIEAVFANTFNVISSGAFTRITFSEYYPEHGSNHHTAIVLPTEGLQGLSELLAQIVENNQEAIRQQSH